MLKTRLKGSYCNWSPKMFVFCWSIIISSCCKLIYGPWIVFREKSQIPQRRIEYTKKLVKSYFSFSNFRAYKWIFIPYPSSFVFRAPALHQTKPVREILEDHSHPNFCSSSCHYHFFIFLQFFLFLNLLFWTS